jgi:hypothetical protein
MTCIASLFTPGISWYLEALLLLVPNHCPVLESYSEGAHQARVPQRCIPRFVTIRVNSRWASHCSDRAIKIGARSRLQLADRVNPTQSISKRCGGILQSFDLSDKACINIIQKTNHLRTLLAKQGFGPDCFYVFSNTFLETRPEMSTMERR